MVGGRNGHVYYWAWKEGEGDGGPGDKHAGGCFEKWVEVATAMYDNGRGLSELVRG